MTVPAVFFDVEGLLADWVIAQAIEVDSLPGLPVKALLSQPGSKQPIPNAYVLLTAGRGDDSFTAEGAQLQTVNGQVYGPTRKAAIDAAVAYAEALRGLSAGNVPVPAVDPVARLGLDFVTAPLWAPDHSKARYLVDAGLIVAPAA